MRVGATYHCSGANAKANNETADGHLRDGVCGGLENGTNSKKGAANVDSDLATIL